MGVVESFDEKKRLITQYAAMSDAELLQLAERSWELSDAAWDALEDELDRRGLEAPAPEEVPQVEALERRNLVLLRRFRDLPEALLAKGMLESAGISCSLADDNMVRLDWFISNLLGGVKLMVDAEDFAEASRVLNEPAPQEFEDEE
jgi:putative signal transducing protein